MQLVVRRINLENIYFESKLFLSSLISNRDSDFFGHIIQIWITSTEFSADPVASSLGNLPTSDNDIKLTGLTRSKDRIHVKSIFYECHETRDFGFIITSRGTVDDFNFHSNSSIVSRTPELTRASRALRRHDRLRQTQAQNMIADFSFPFY